MTIEEMNAFAQTDAGKAWLEPIQAGELPKYMSPNSPEFSTFIEEAKKPLLTKKTELETETKAAKKARLEAEAKLGDTTRYLHLLEDFNIGLDDEGKVSYSKVEEVLRNIRAGKDDPAAGANSAEMTEVRMRLKKTQREFDGKIQEIGLKEVEIQKAQADIEVRDSYIHGLLITNTMRAALSKAGYPEITIANILPNLVAKSGAQVNYDESLEEINRRWSAITDDGRSVDEWIKYWSTTEEGLFFMPGRQNSGGGAGGSGNTGKAKAWSDMSQQERMALYRRDPGMYRAAKNAATNG